MEVTWVLKKKRTGSAYTCFNSDSTSDFADFGAIRCCSAQESKLIVIYKALLVVKSKEWHGSSICTDYIYLAMAF